MQSEPNSNAGISPVERPVRPAATCTDGHPRGRLDQCKNMRCTYEGLDGERYRCDVCGRSYFLDYEEMR